MLIPPKSNTHACNMSSRVWIVHSFCSSVCGWKFVLKWRRVPISSWNCFQNLQVKRTSQPETTDTDTLWRDTISWTKISISFSAKILFWIGIKCTLLVNRSTMTQVESTLCAVLGSFVIKSIVMSSHFHTGIYNGCILPWGRWCSALIFLQVKHRSTNHTISRFMQGHQ